MVLALMGNQNSGKTTLFNQLTGSNQHVGNFPGVTVERKAGPVRGHGEMVVVDLPGVYSLRPFSGEEMVTRDYLLKGNPDGIINILDATNLERSLYLTLQLMDLGLPMVLALNMMDEVRGDGGKIDANLLAQGLDLPVVPIAAAKGEGIDELAQRAMSAVRKGKPVTRFRPRNPILERCLMETGQVVRAKAEAAGIPTAFAAAKVVEGDGPILEALELDPVEARVAEEAVERMERESGRERNEAIARARYRFIEELCARALKKGPRNRGRERSARLDSVLTHRYLGIPIFLGIMLLVFWLTFGVIGNALSELLSEGIGMLSHLVEDWMLRMDVSPVLRSLVVEGVFAGVGSVLSFLPIIVTLFFFLSILEDSGYMARVAFLMDRLLRSLGLSGRSFVPMLIGFGCTVPAILAARTLPGERDRKLTIMLLPFMSCSAKLPIYAVFTAAFFQEHQALVMILLYVGGILMGVAAGLLLKRTAFPGKEAPFLMELPSYRFPSPKSVALLIWERAWDFLARAFTVIFFASLIIWFLQSFNYQFRMVEDSSISMLATLGRYVTPLFHPIGIDDWRVSTALLTGLTAKEAVVSTLAVLSGAGVADLPGALETMFTPLTAASFLVFTLLYTPCVAAVGAVSRELKSAGAALSMVAFQCTVAWIAAFLVFQGGRLLGLG